MRLLHFGAALAGSRWPWPLRPEANARCSVRQFLVLGDQPYLSVDVFQRPLPPLAVITQLVTRSLDIFITVFSSLTVYYLRKSATQAAMPASNAPIEPIAVHINIESGPLDATAWAIDVVVGLAIPVPATVGTDDVCTGAVE
jgi:hypothetical protein